MDIYLITSLMQISHNTQEESTERALDDLIFYELVDYINSDDCSAHKEALCWFIDYKDCIIKEIQKQETLGYITKEYCDIDTVFGFVDDITSIYTVEELKFQFRWWFDVLWVYCNFNTVPLKYLLDKLDMEMIE